MNVNVTREQFDGVKNLLGTLSREIILDRHTKAVDRGDKKFWPIAGLNDLSKEQMAVLLYNPDAAIVEPSTEDKLRILASSATNKNYYDGVVDTAELLGFPRSIFDSVPFEGEEIS